MVLVHLDSKSRDITSRSICDCTFSLNVPITNVSQYRVQNISFYNTFHNINQTNNELSTDSGKITIEPGFYNASVFVSILNAQLSNLLGIVKDYVVLNTANSRLTWDLGANIIYNCPMSDTLGLSKNMDVSGNFTSTLFLADPAYLSISSPQLNLEQNIHGGLRGKDDQPMSFLTVPVSVPYLSQSVYDNRLYDNRFKQFGTNMTFSRLDFTVIDPQSGRFYAETVHWSMIIEFI